MRCMLHSQTSGHSIENVLSVLSLQPCLVRPIASCSHCVRVTARRYCSVECQQTHWPQHSTVCCAFGTFLPGDTNSARSAAARQPERLRCGGAVFCVGQGENRALGCGPGRQRRVYLSEGCQSSSPPTPSFCAVFLSSAFRLRTDLTFSVICVTLWNHVANTKYCHG